MCLEETVAHCAAAMLTFIKAITEEVVATMQKDVTMLQAFFSKYLKQDKVRVQGRADNCCMGRGGLGWYRVCAAICHGQTAALPFGGRVVLSGVLGVC